MHEEHVERHQTESEAEHLLAQHEDLMEMADLGRGQARDKSEPQVGGRYTDEQRNVEASGSRSVPSGEEVALADRQGVEYRVYKIRWFGLMQLILLNIVVSWDVS